MSGNTWSAASVPVTRCRGRGVGVGAQDEVLGFVMMHACVCVYMCACVCVFTCACVCVRLHVDVYSAGIEHAHKCGYAYVSILTFVHEYTH